MLATVLIGLLVSLGLGDGPAEVSEPPSRMETSATALANDTSEVLLSLTQQLDHPRARATIIRPAGEGLPDMILVVEETTPEDLDRAVQMLLAARSSFGASVDREMRAHVPLAEAGATDPDRIAEATHHLFEVRSGQDVEVPGFGPTKSIMITVAD